MEMDNATVEAAAEHLTTEHQEVPPDYLIATYATLAGADVADALTYCTSTRTEVGLATWSLLGVLPGGLVLKIRATGAPANPNPGPFDPLPIATSIDARIYRASDVVTVGLKALDAMPDPDGEGIRWRNWWTITFTDGDEMELPASYELDKISAGRQADAVALAIRLTFGR